MSAIIPFIFHKEIEITEAQIAAIGAIIGVNMAFKCVQVILSADKGTMIASGEYVSRDFKPAEDGSIIVKDEGTFFYKECEVSIEKIDAICSLIGVQRDELNHAAIIIDGQDCLINGRGISQSRKLPEGAFPFMWLKWQDDDEATNG